MTPPDDASEDRPEDAVAIESAPQDADGEEKTKEPLTLTLKVEEPSVCERRVVVTIPRADIDRYLDRAFDEVMPKAQVRGFRIGKAPVGLVRKQFKEDVSERVKSELLMDSMTQISDDLKFSAISEPDFDFEAIDIPDSGDMTFEFTIEVRPEFELPEYKGIQLSKPTRDFTEADVDQHLKSVLSRFATLASKDGPVAEGDFVTCNVKFRHEGKLVSEIEDESICVRPKLSFPDGEIDNFGEVMQGAVKGDKRTAEVEVGADAANESLRGKKVEAEIEVLEVETSTLPELDSEFLDKIGGFEDEKALREVLRGEMERQLTYHQNRELRDQISKLLTESADWTLPPELLKRQAAREMERALIELQSSGFDEGDVQRHMNEIQRNIMDSTRRALKEHFILERIAEEETIDATEADFNLQIELLARQQNESPRSVRAKLEKRGGFDTLRNHIVEGKVLAMIQEQAKFTETAYEPRPTNTESIPHAIAGRASNEAIPAAKYDDSSREGANELK
ncbi:trigger factor [Lignipirellula cremea]|uniref:Trigger factor n=1 Tax=Lignipirellula cremea TaxID=2528010 RepID=A0A518E2E6_9BACT|nr:trigger factor [Lignipirellula cremea]QDU98265.1 Trigger factor [Lignipirellula cremea]